MDGYHYITVVFVMRDCEGAEDAVRQLVRLLPHYPDESTIHIESWSVDAVHGGDGLYARSIDEDALEALVEKAEVNHV